MTFYSMQYLKKYSDSANKKWAARKNGLPVPCLQVIIQTGKIEPEICQHSAVLKMCILTMLPKGNFGVSGISAALLREQYIICRCRKNIPITVSIFFSGELPLNWRKDYCAIKRGQNMVCSQYLWLEVFQQTHQAYFSIDV